jgi:hypothetical protein
MKRSWIKRKSSDTDARQRMRRTMMRYNAPRAGSRRALKARLDSLTAQIVKMRDGHVCVICQSTFIIDCGHVYSRRLIATRWNLDNCFAQCRNCNTRHIVRPEIYLSWYQERFGADALIALHTLAYSGKTFSDEELGQMISEYEAKLEQLRSDLEVAA